MCVSLDGLKEFLGDVAYGHWLQDNEWPKTQLVCVHNFVLSAIVPCQPRTDEQIAAFSQAVYAQTRDHWLYPPDVKKLSIGSFSAETEPREGLCRDAKAFLMNAGLLSRSVPLC